MKGSMATLVVALVWSCGLFSAAEGDILQGLGLGSNPTGTSCGAAGSLACISGTPLHALDLFGGHQQRSKCTLNRETYPGMIELSGVRRHFLDICHAAFKFWLTQPTRILL